jgi:hypothetical protein
MIRKSRLNLKPSTNYRGYFASSEKILLFIGPCKVKRKELRRSRSWLI